MMSGHITCLLSQRFPFCFFELHTHYHYSGDMTALHYVCGYAHRWCLRRIIPCFEYTHRYFDVFLFTGLNASCGSLSFLFCGWFIGITFSA